MMVMMMIICNHHYLYNYLTHTTFIIIFAVHCISIAIRHCVESYFGNRTQNGEKWKKHVLKAY